MKERMIEILKEHHKMYDAYFDFESAADAIIKELQSTNNKVDEKELPTPQELAKQGVEYYKAEGIEETAAEFYNQEYNVKPSQESCFANTEGITYTSGEIDQESIHSESEIIAFAEAYYQSKSKVDIEISEEECERLNMPEHNRCYNCGAKAGHPCELKPK